MPVLSDQALAWAEFCRTIEDRILEVRAEAGPLACETCGSSTPKVMHHKWCPGCQQMRPASRFYRDRSKGNRLDWSCRDCRIKRNKAYRAKVAKNGGIGASGRVVRVSGRMGQAS